MKQLTAFTKKEFMECSRTGKLLILSILFILFGIMNPAIAKLTPWMMEMMSDSLAENGMQISVVHVDAMTSWAQFYKNIPIALIIFLVMFSTILTQEYHKGTLIHMITKGMRRWKIILSKAFVMVTLWTAGFFICFGITYGYNAYFWDNKIIHNILFTALSFYISGIWLISLILFFQVISKSGSFVLIGSVTVFLLVWLAGLMPDVKKFLPVQLLDSGNLMSGINSPKDYWPAIIITVICSVLNICGAVLYFNKNIKSVD